MLTTPRFKTSHLRNVLRNHAIRELSGVVVRALILEIEKRETEATFAPDHCFELREGCPGLLCKLGVPSKGDRASSSLLDRSRGR